MLAALDVTFGQSKTGLGSPAAVRIAIKLPPKRLDGRGVLRGIKPGQPSTIDQILVFLIDGGVGFATLQRP